MSSNAFSHVLRSTIFKTFLETLLRRMFEYLISFLFVQIPTFCHHLITLGAYDVISVKQKRTRAKLIDESDPLSAYRAIEVLDKLQTQPEHNVKTLADIPDLCLKRYADKETMGVREILDVEREKQNDGKVFKKFIMGHYKFTTYRELCARIDKIGRGFLSLGAKPGDRVLIFSETRAEWFVTALAVLQRSLTLVTILPITAEDALKHGINESEVEIVITSHELLPKIEKIFNQTKKVRYIIYFPILAKPDEARVPEDKNNIEFIPLAKLEEQGKNTYFDEKLLKQRPETTDTAMIIYTSGSTGTPKGVSLTHENFVNALAGHQERILPYIDVDNDIYIAYLPLAHILEFCFEILMFYHGVKFGYSSPQTLTDQSTAIKHGEKGDLQVLRPHFMACVPTILNRIQKTINEKVNQSNVFQRQLFNLAYAIKLKRLESGLESPYLDRLIFSRFNKMVLGGRVKSMLCGGAMLCEDTQLFLRAVLPVKLSQAYASTETCGVGTVADQYDIANGHVGHPLISGEIRLVNWDEGQYRTTDKPNARGELLLGGKAVAAGYFGEASKENYNFKEIDGTRYFCSGDIGEIFPDGTLKIIDRKKDMIKLHNGEFISLAKVEVAINKLPFVENCYVCASPSAEHSVALICVKPKEMENFTENHFNETDWKKIVNDEEFNNELLKAIQDVCKSGRVEKYEIPQRIKLTMDSWTPDNGLVTGALKLKRKAIGEKYKDDIKQLYENKSGRDLSGINEPKSEMNNEYNSNKNATKVY